jgi:TRAP-type C4-dicarboxylate transport system substrate-binding protein
VSLRATVHARTFKLSHVCSKDHSYQVATDYFAKRIAAETAGTIKVKLYPNAALDDEDTLVEGLQLGTVHLAVAAPGKPEGFVKELGSFGLPFLFPSMEQKYKLLDGEIGAIMTKIIESRIPVKVLGYWQSGVRNLFNSKRPVYSAEDLTGSKIHRPVLPGYAPHSLRGLLP